MKIETKRLILRPIKKSDWKDLVECVREIDVAKMTKNIPHPYKKKDAVNIIKYAMKEGRKKNKKYYIFFIELKSEKKIIGTTGIYDISQHHSKCTTGSFINKKYWRKGYLLEAKVPVLDFVFNKLKLRKIETGVYKENTASNNMSKKLGFKFEGIRKKSLKSQADGKIHDNVLYGLLKEDWKKVRPKVIKNLNKKIK